MVKNALRRKLLRDMWKNRMQFVAVILLCALGTWVFTGLDASWRMIDLSANTYFKQQNLADLWVTLPNVDHAAEYRLQNLAGVSGVNLRATVDLETDLPGEPTLLVTAYDGEMDINQPLLYEGEQLARNDRRGCLLDRMFALENGLQPGDGIGLKLGGETHRFTIRGLCLSPEYTALSKDALPDHASYGFVLINASALSALPLNSAVLTLAEGAESDTVEKAVLALYPEALILNHASHSATHGVGKDVDMFRNLSYLFPLLAYAVAAMIVLTTITRMLENQRMQMGTLKALGYRDGQLLRHYLSYAFYPSLVGSVMGMVVGRVTLPYILWALEEVQFSLPYQLQAPVSAGQWGMCVLGVALSCAICFHTYRKSAKENTAQLLRPKPPKAGKKLLLERCGFVWRRIGFNAKMVMRNLFRNKARTLMSLMGVLCCNALIISSLGL
ncbi:MAG: ABC transporter permease [Clostridia bacterium]|nr:ABC transporter permease [Clostridia bacterium]